MRRLKVSKAGIALQQHGQRCLALLAFAGQEHPQVLYSRRHARVVQIYQMRTVIGPQDIAAVTIAVHPDKRSFAAALITPLHPLQQVFGQRLVGGYEFGRNEVVF